MAQSSGLISRLDKLNEFERLPISEDHLKGGRHFAGLFSGEHVAATEFVIGALFVNKGAQAFDVVVGLIIGNLLAVLSWALICAPIAVKTRLTLYWYLRKIGGPFMMVIYNILNAVMFCVLAGSMITVSASAIRIPFGIEPQIGWLPTDFRFVLIVLAVGAVVVTLAILGFTKLAQFATVCSPWMFLMFIAGALTMIPSIIASSPEVSSIHSFSDFWHLAQTRIWPGPAEGQTDILGFWHIAAFAWIANVAMHLGLSDMALFRYAKKASYGFYSAFGMFLGHYLAWICAGIMGAGAALLIGTPLTELDAGGVAYKALGLSGALAVVIAGWTTSNPTIYRAGLALQIATPNWPRWKVTFFAGVATTIVACSPFVFTKLLDFVGYYGLLLMPVGAIVVVEHWIFPKIGFNQYWTSRKGLNANVPALLAWGITLAGAITVVQLGILHLFFTTIPVWIISAVLYIIFSAMMGARETLPPMEEEKQAAPANMGAIDKSPQDVLGNLMGVVALASLFVSLFIAITVATKSGEEYTAALASYQSKAAILTVVYFVTSILWIVRKDRKKKA